MPAEDGNETEVHVPGDARLKREPASAGSSMCRGCGIAYASHSFVFRFDGVSAVRFERCPKCSQWHALLAVAVINESGRFIQVENVVWPAPKTDLPMPPEVPAHVAYDLKEAHAVMQASAKASAALSRRLLQRMLHERGIKKKNLSDEIDALLEQKILPSTIAEDIDAIRTIGNFAAHPIKSASTGEIVDVEEGEAEWLVKVIQELCDSFYVQPARQAIRRKELNDKLVAAGKQPLKTPES